VSVSVSPVELEVVGSPVVGASPVLVVGTGREVPGPEVMVEPPVVGPVSVSAPVLVGPPVLPVAVVSEPPSGQPASASAHT
jgi:hypothetical protein